MPDLQALIALLETPGIGRKTARRVWGSPLKLRSSLPAEKELRSAEKILAACRRLNVSVLSHLDPDFPENLKNIPDPPLVLYCVGSLKALNGFSLALVGTRQPSPEGKARAFAFGGILAELGTGVVSGLALGIDAEAHLGCLKKKGRTVAVLPSGIGRIYPRANEGLAKLIVKNEGCLVSEYPPLTGPEPFRFIERDRLQSGLSNGTVVIESEASGGAMHTARFCRKQRKPLAACEGSPALLKWEGIVRIGDESGLGRFAERAADHHFQAERGLLQ